MTGEKLDQIRRYEVLAELAPRLHIFPQAPRIVYPACKLPVIDELFAAFFLNILFSARNRIDSGDQVHTVLPADNSPVTVLADPVDKQFSCRHVDRGEKLCVTKCRTGEAGNRCGKPRACSGRPFLFDSRGKFFELPQCHKRYKPVPICKPGPALKGRKGAPRRLFEIDPQCRPFPFTLEYPFEERALFNRALSGHLFERNKIDRSLFHYLVAKFIRQLLRLPEHCLRIVSRFKGGLDCIVHLAFKRVEFLQS